MVVGRYISDDYGGVALHPIDIIDVSTGMERVAGICWDAASSIGVYCGSLFSFWGSCLMSDSKEILQSALLL